MPRVSVQNLNKDFKIYERPQDRLYEIILRKQRHQLYHVLTDISFAVPDGKSLGIIGDNGAGKSTLLKLLVGTLQPTSGDIAINGQVAALLELGAGFHPEFTGRKNIYLNAALLGVPDDNIAEMERDIIAFSELDYFIDRPVKTYSSGMYVRLAFSIATMVRPDILVIDEALSVGDMAFQKKCVQRMNEFRAAAEDHGVLQSLHVSRARAMRYRDLVRQGQDPGDWRQRQGCGALRRLLQQQENL